MKCEEGREGKRVFFRDTGVAKYLPVTSCNADISMYISASILSQNLPLSQQEDVETVMSKPAIKDGLK